MRTDWETLLAQDQMPEILDLKYQNLGPGGFEALLRVISNPGRCSKLRELHLNSINIGDEGLKKLIEPLKQLQLTFIDLTFNNITTEGAKHILELAKACPSIVQIMTIGNDLTPSMEKQIYQATESNRRNALSGGGSATTLVSSPSSSSSSSSSSSTSTIPPQQSESPTSGITQSTTPTTTPPASAMPQLVAAAATVSLRSSRDEKERKSSRDKKVDKGSRVKDKKKKRTISSSSSSIRSSGGSSGGETSDGDLAKKVAALQAELAEKNRVIDDLLLQLQKSNTSAASAPATPATGRAKEKSINLRNISVNEKLSSGGGSNATIFSCYVDGWQCAMKELYIAQMNPDEIKNFEQEIQLLESLPFNNNIVRYLFHEKDANKIRLYITRYACSLRDRILERRRDIEFNNGDGYSVREITKHCLDIAKGLSFLHQNAIIHRDLKSDNIFVKLNEQKEISELAIGDFDTAKKVSTGRHAKTLVGTPPYMAPEVLLSNNTDAYTFKADVYSLGMIIYEFLTLKMPYEDENQYNLLNLKIKGTRPRLPPDMHPSYKPMIDLYERCTHVNPDERPDLFTIKEELIRWM